MHHFIERPLYRFITSDDKLCCEIYDLYNGLIFTDKRIDDY